ncbi:hypothetical protein FKM82_011261 [Ascaphus truei]
MRGDAVCHQMAGGPGTVVRSVADGRDGERVAVGLQRFPWLIWTSISRWDVEDEFTKHLRGAKEDGSDYIVGNIIQ